MEVENKIRENIHRKDIEKILKKYWKNIIKILKRRDIKKKNIKRKYIKKRDIKKKILQIEEIKKKIEKKVKILKKQNIKF